MESRDWDPLMAQVALAKLSWWYSLKREELNLLVEKLQREETAMLPEGLVECTSQLLMMTTCPSIG